MSINAVNNAALQVRQAAAVGTFWAGVGFLGGAAVNYARQVPLVDATYPLAASISSVVESAFSPLFNTLQQKGKALLDDRSFGHYKHYVDNLNPFVRTAVISVVTAKCCTGLGYEMSVGEAWLKGVLIPTITLLAGGYLVGAFSQSTPQVPLVVIPPQPGHAGTGEV